MVVTDYVDSAPLSDCPKQENHLGILSQVKKVLKLLHGNDLVFGDLRPENIVLDAHGGAKLIDFDFVGTLLQRTISFIPFFPFSSLLLNHPLIT